jgi:hypothetical protein
VHKIIFSKIFVTVLAISNGNDTNYKTRKKNLRLT